MPEFQTIKAFKAISGMRRFPDVVIPLLLPSKIYTIILTSILDIPPSYLCVVQSCNFSHCFLFLRAMLFDSICQFYSSEIGVEKTFFWRCSGEISKSRVTQNGP